MPDESVFFAETKPIGFILFARNCINPKQLKKLIKDLRKSINNDKAPILIDQEGGPSSEAWSASLERAAGRTGICRFGDKRY